jgi:hypothetical protein
MSQGMALARVLSVTISLLCVLQYLLDVQGCEPYGVSTCTWFCLEIFRRGYYISLEYVTGRTSQNVC